ncbi:M43 family zinc metalloprotease [Bacteroidota bacterium]|nr:M43 family zinc metalloprotease [Bacteroidota bacterium]|tara:strand:- start:3303 stop:5363 length:2061 start_codon:yes stop_codon:yes gene_type:complete
MKKSVYQFFLFTIFIFQTPSFLSQSPQHSCGQHIVLKELLKNDDFKAYYDQEQKSFSSNNQISAPKSSVLHKIPVVFHIVHNNGVEKIDRSQVLDALEKLNIDLRALRPDTSTVDSLFKPLIADIEVEFVLATKAPDGTCFSGITMTETPFSYNNGDINGSDQVDAVMMSNDVFQGNWPGNQYLNVFVCGSVGTGIAGYTYYPSGFFGNAMNNGIWLRHDYCGSIGTANPSASKTFVHEVGHWLNLPHTWGSTNEPGLASNCSSDDGVADTPNTIGSQWCNYNETTCGSVANIENHMEYSPCRKMFTLGQKARMRTALNSSTGGRSNLITPANHFATGIDTTAPFCKADFFANRYITCTGDSLYFQDYSYHNPISWNWHFEGANPDSSILENTYATYPLPGVFDVALTATGDSTNYLTELKNDAIIVMDYNGEQLPYYEGFENINFNTPEWISNVGNWSITDEAAYNGNYSLKLENDGVAEGTKHILESKTFDLSDSSKVFFNFKYAFARKNNSNNEVLKLLASNDCGKTWSLRKIIQYSQLTTAPDQNNFIPTFSEWKEATVTSIIGPLCVQNFRFKFEFQSGGGNNLYIDNINISYENTTGVSKSFISEISIYPNPTNDILNIVSSNSFSKIQVLDMMGKEVLMKNESNMKRAVINTSFLDNGYYSIKISQGNQVNFYSFIKVN